MAFKPSERTHYEKNIHKLNIFPFIIIIITIIPLSFFLFAQNGIEDYLKEISFNSQKINENNADIFIFLSKQKSIVLYKEITLTINKIEDAEEWRRVINNFALKEKEIVIIPSKEIEFFSLKRFIYFLKYNEVTNISLLNRKV